MSEQEIARKLREHDRRLDALESIESWNGKTSAVAHAVSILQHLPGIRGVWPMSAIDSAGSAIDVSGQGRTLTYNGNLTYNFYNDFVPYIDLDGVGDYLSRADEAGLDILGTETYVAAAVRGLTIGGWFWIDDLTANRENMGKYLTAGNQRSYRLVSTVGGGQVFQVSIDGINVVSISSSAGTISTSVWYFLCGRFIPSAEMTLFVNDSKWFTVSGVPASIFNSNAPFEIGRGANIMDGRASLCFLSTMALSDDWLKYIFQNTRCLFGV